MSTNNYNGGHFTNSQGQIWIQFWNNDLQMQYTTVECENSCYEEIRNN